MESHRRIVPPLLDDSFTNPEFVLEMDDDWEELEELRPVLPAAFGLFPPARSDAEIAAIVNEFTDELCGSFY